MPIKQKFLFSPRKGLARLSDRAGVELSPNSLYFVPREGLEPSRTCVHGILSAACLPISSPRQIYILQDTNNNAYLISQLFCHIFFKIAIFIRAFYIFSFNNQQGSAFWAFFASRLIPERKIAFWKLVASVKYFVFFGSFFNNFPFFAFRAFYV